MQHSPPNYKLFCCNIGKINTDNLWRDNFEMFIASQLHNAFQVVVQFERHCWLSLAAGIFLHHIEWCCQNSVLLKTLQAPANKCPPPNVGPDCWKPAQALWPPSKPGHFGNCHTQVPGSMSVARWGRLCGLGVGKHTWPKTNFRRSARCANSKPIKIPGKGRPCKNNTTGLTGLDGRLTWSHPAHMKLGSMHNSIPLTSPHWAKAYVHVLSQFTLFSFSGLKNEHMQKWII